MYPLIEEAYMIKTTVVLFFDSASGESRGGLATSGLQGLTFVGGDVEKLLNILPPPAHDQQVEDGKWINWLDLPMCLTIQEIRQVRSNRFEYRVTYGQISVNIVGRFGVESDGWYPIECATALDIEVHTYNNTPLRPQP